jgi:hypothetical protein
MSGVFEGVMGMLSVVFVTISRHGWAGLHPKEVFVRGRWKGFIVVFAILFLFAFAKESSGLNRFLAKGSIMKMEG